jgi:hypothetical protein
MITLRNTVGRVTRNGLNQLKVSAPKTPLTFIASRYNSASTSTTTTTTTPITTPGPASKQDSPPSPPKNSAHRSKDGRKGAPSGKRGPARRVNSKVRDITSQIKTVILENKDLNEAYDILEEGIVFLRSIQKEEQIQDRTLFYAFYPLAIELFDLVMKRGGPEFKKSLDELLDFFVENKIAHPWHFLQVGLHKWRTASDAAKARGDPFEEFIAIWLRCFEYGSMNGFVYTREIDPIQGRDQKLDFGHSYLTNLVYAAYLNLCMLEKTTYSEEDAKRFHPEGQIPSRFLVFRILNHFELANQVEKNKIAKFLDYLRRQNYDPNGPVALEDIDKSATKRKLEIVYSDIVYASKERNVQIHEKTVCALMERFLVFDDFDAVFALFESITDSGVLPGPDTWAVALRAMTMPTRIRIEARKDAKEEVLATFERTVASFLASGLSFNSRVLTAVVAGYANLGEFEKAEEYRAKHPSLFGHSTMDALVRGYVQLKQVETAEKRLQEFLSAKGTKNEGPYKPSTDTMNTFLNYYTKKKNYDAVNGLMTFMEQRGIEENVATKTIMVDAYVSNMISIGKTPDLSAIMKRIQKKGHNQALFSAILKGLIEGGNITSARSLFGYLKKAFPNSPELYTQMIIGEISIGDIRIAEELFNWYIKEIENLVLVWNTFIRALLPKSDAMAKLYFHRMKEHHQQPNYFTYYFMLDHFTRMNDKQEVQWLVDELDASNIQDFGSKLPDILQRLSTKVDVSPGLLARAQQR